jgi:aspartate aminotransferase
MPDKQSLRQALFTSQLMIGYAFPNALLQHAIADLDNLSIDVAQLQRRRDRLVSELTSMGYSVQAPEATFYLMPKSPLEDDLRFIEILARHNVYCLPGTIVEMPGRFRISITANDEMVERSLAGFEAALRDAREEMAPAGSGHLNRPRA